jgi:hypothetical protein
MGLARGKEDEEPAIKNINKAAKRLQGVNLAASKLSGHGHTKVQANEEVEDLDESKTHYMSGFNSEKTGKQRKHNPFKEGSPAAHYWAKGWEHSNDGKQPQKFVNEEAENIDELSKGTLASYTKKAIGSMKSLEDASDRAHQKGHDTYKAGATKTSDKMFKLSDRHLKKSGKRGEGINTAINKLAKEEVENIDELSKGTLASYVKKAVPSAIQHGIKHGEKKAERDEQDRNMNRHMSFSDKDKVHDIMKTTYKDVEKPRQKAMRRLQGIDRAVGKITKEEVEFTQEEIDFIEATMSDLD